MGEAVFQWEKRLRANVRIALLKVRSPEATYPRTLLPPPLFGFCVAWPKKHTE